MGEILEYQDSGFERSRKQILWEEQITSLNEVKTWPPIDENIKETLAALNVNGIRTIASCGGHMIQERKAGDTPFPWILASSGGKIGNQSPREHGNEAHSAAEALLAEFYKVRHVEDSIKLEATPPAHGEFSLTSIADRQFLARLAKGELTEEERQDLVAKLPERQREIEEFGQFLKSRFFAGDPQASS